MKVLSSPAADPDVSSKQYVDQASSGRPSYSYASSLSGLKNRYSNEFGIYNFKSSNTRILNQGLANCMMGKSGGGMTEHLWIGDSLSAGTVSAVGVYTFDRLNSVALAFRDNLANCGVPANGTGFVRIADSTVTPDSRWAFTGSTWSNSNQSMLASNASGAIATFTADRAGTICDVWYYDATGATFTVTVNGVLAATVVCTGSAGWKYQHITGLNIQPGSKVVLNVTVQGTFGAFLSGLSIWTPNAGLVMHNVAQNGSLASGTGSTSWSDVATNTAPGQVFQYVAGTSRTVTDAGSTVGSPNLTSATANFTSADIGRPFDQTPGAAGPMFPPQSYIGSINSTTSAVVHTMVNGVSTPTNAVATGTITGQTVRIGREPSCVHIVLGVNDMLAAASASTITTAITTIRNRYPNSDCILHLEPEMAYSFVAQATQQAFWQAMYALADTLDVPLVDWHDRVGTYAQGQANGVYGDVNVHLTGATQASIGASLAQVVGFGSAQPQTGVTPTYPQDLVNKKTLDDSGRRVSVAPGATATTTTEAVVAKVFIPANTFKVGSIIKYSLWASSAATATVVTTRIRIGTAGTTSDASLIIMSASASTAGARYMEGVDAIQAIGTSATHIGGGTSTIGSATAAGTAVAATSSFDSTKDNWVSITLQNTTSATTTVYAGQLEVNI